MILPIPYAKTLKVNKISNTLFEVEDKKVKIQTKTGRQLLICDCCNDTRFCTESPMCVHKLAVLNYLINNNLDKRLDKLIKEYKNYKNLSLPVSVDCMLNDLNDIKHLR